MKLLWSVFCWLNLVQKITESEVVIIGSLPLIESPISPLIPGGPGGPGGPGRPGGPLEIERG